MPDVHPSAIVHPDAQLADGVFVGPNCIIEDRSTIGENTWIEANAKIGRYTRIGRDCKIHFGAVIGHASVDLKYRGGECWTHIGDRNIFREYVTVSGSSFEGKATIIGNDNLLMHFTNVAHDCIFGDKIIMANFATFGGHVEVEGNCRIGAHAAYHQFVRVGRGSMSGACSKFTKDLPPYTVGDGHPAVLHGLNTLGRETAQNHPMRDVPDESIALLKRAYRLLFRSGLRLEAAIARVREELPDDPHVRHLTEFIESSSRGVCPARHDSE